MTRVVFSNVMTNGGLSVRRSGWHTTNPLQFVPVSISCDAPAAHYCQHHSYVCHRLLCTFNSNFIHQIDVGELRVPLAWKVINVWVWVLGVGVGDGESGYMLWNTGWAQRGPLVQNHRLVRSHLLWNLLVSHRFLFLLLLLLLLQLLLNHNGMFNAVTIVN